MRLIVGYYYYLLIKAKYLTKLQSFENTKITMLRFALVIIELLHFGVFEKYIKKQPGPGTPK